MSGDSSAARERLRQYLEQRRELGERELVLDSMSVDDVLRVVGLNRGDAPLKPRRPRPAVPPTPEPSTALAAAPAPDPDAAIEYDLDDDEEFVEEDLDADLAGDVGAPADHPRLRGEPAAGAVDRAGPQRAGPDAATPPSAEPSAPAGDDAPPLDWRTALRDANAEPESTRRTAPEPESMPSRRSAAPPATSAAAPTSSVAPTPAYVTGELFPGLDVPIGVVAVGAGTELFGGPTEGLDSIAHVADAVRACTRCQLYKTATNGVPGEGPIDADFVVVGEAPGADEDASGRPFVGASGQLLTKILAAINLRREDVFIANVVKHRPPGNRNPAPDEVAACSPYLVRQLELVRPKVILTVGNFAAQTLLGTKLGISKLRGQVHLYHGVPLVATYHPAALLRNPTWKRPTWEDVQLARRLLDRAASPG